MAFSQRVQDLTGKEDMKKGGDFTGIKITKHVFFKRRMQIIKAV